MAKAASMRMSKLAPSATSPATSPRRRREAASWMTTMAILPPQMPTWSRWTVVPPTARARARPRSSDLVLYNVLLINIWFNPVNFVYFGFDWVCRMNNLCLNLSISLCARNSFVMFIYVLRCSMHYMDLVRYKWTVRSLPASVSNAHMGLDTSSGRVDRAYGLRYADCGCRCSYHQEVGTAR